MQKKKSRQTRKSQSKKKQNNLNKYICTICPIKLGLTVHIQQALQRKYSANSLSYFLRIQNQIDTQKRLRPETMEPKRQLMEKYYKPMQRKHQFYKIKQIYELHKQAPKIYMQGIVQILNKRHFRKRLLQYFKIAKILGLKVSGAKTSTFLYSLSKTMMPQDVKGSYEKILGQISTYEFSEEIQRQLLQNLEKGENVNKGLNPECSFVSPQKNKVVIERYKI